ncbi:SDR family oxidoreductase [Streptomyces sp. NPDC127036]|uniref:SDR family oxidoreductase n=1 Tax=Streptomyces sp. NPDC127036 TaxID=3347112 RepID=UPI003662E26E
MKKPYDMSVPDLHGRLAVVTGGSDGIGLKLAQRLALAGAEVILPVRSAVKGDMALEQIRSAVPRAMISSRVVDLASLASVKSLADTLLAEGRPINFLVNNAGVMAPATRHTTADGFELQFATNHLGHMALTGRLMLLLRAGEARVTTVTSSAARGAKIDWGDLQSAERYSPVRSYGASKLANLLFALELDRRSRVGGWGIVSNAAHPGTTLTNLYASGPNLGRNRPAPHEAIMRRLASWGVLVHSAEAGMLSPLYAVASPQAQGGALYGPDGFGQFTGGPAELSIYKSALSASDATQLWQVSERLTGVLFETKV